MFDPTTESIEMYTLLALGAAAVCSGLPGLFFPSRPAGSPAWRRALAVSLVLGLLGGGTALAGLPQFVWVPALSLAGAWLFFAVLRGGRVGSMSLAAARAASQPRLQTAAMVLAGGSLLAWQSYALTASVEKVLEESDALLMAVSPAPPLEPHPAMSACTDAGQTIPLWRPVGEASARKEPDHGSEFLRQRGYHEKVIRTDGPDLNYNCHGWVFLGGKGWLRGGNVEQILRDNRYEIVSSPSPGDVAVYRDAAGSVSHTALVRAVFDDGTVLMESKWGKLGRYLHTASQHAYAHDSCTYYRAPRGSHVLRLNPAL